MVIKLVFIGCGGRVWLMISFDFRYLDVTSLLTGDVLGGVVQVMRLI